MGIWKRATKARIRQADRTHMKGGKYIVNSSFVIPGALQETPLPLFNKFNLDAEVFDIGHKDVILGLSWLKENGFSVDVPNSRLVNELSRVIIPCTTRHIPSVTLLALDDNETFDLEEGEILLILDARKQYSRYAAVFSQEQAARLPDHTKWDHQIPLKDSTTKVPGGRMIYKTTWEEKEALEEYVREHLPTGKIRRSRSPASSPILFTRKSNGSLRLCVDYRGLNNLTIPNKYPLPRIDELLEKTRGSKFFTKLDLKNGYYLIRIADGKEWKTAFRTEKGLFEYTVMPFGLTNAPASFQEMMDEIFEGIEGVIWYLDDILIHGGETEEEHQKIVEQILGKCLEHGLAINLEKSEFHQPEVDFLGHVVNGTNISMQERKVNAVLNWKTPAKKKEVQAFLGFANYYRRFIKNYSAKVKPLTELTKDIPFSWGHAQQTAFDDLKTAFTTAPVLRPFDRNLQTIMETDASNQAIAGVLSQYQKNENGAKVLYPVDHHAKTLSATERNWPIHDKELWAIVSYCRRWHSWLVGVPVDIYTDHQGLQYFNTKCRLNSRQAS